MPNVHNKVKSKLKNRVTVWFTAVWSMLFGTFAFAHSVLAQVNTNLNLILGDTSPIDFAILVVNWILGILALIAVVIIIWGGITWLMSGGDEEKINKAKLILRNGLIGLVIVLASWGIARYIINSLLDFTGAEDFYSEPSYTDGDGANSPFYVDHTNPQANEEDVPLCHIVAATFSFPVNQTTVTENSFLVTIPADTVNNPGGGRSDGDTCSEGRQCLSGACGESTNVCEGNRLPGSFDFSESGESAVFYPQTDYFQNTTYRVTLNTSIQGIDPDTGALYNLGSADPKRIFSFTTGSTTDDIPPKVNVTSIAPFPEDSATEICLNPTLQISFSESLDPASPRDTNVWLYLADANGDGTPDDPNDALDIRSIRLNSIGGEPDDTIVTSPELQLAVFTDYAMNLYSGDPLTENLDGAIRDACGNPLSGDFDEDMEGSPVDDFVDPTSAALSQAFCTCISGIDACSVNVGETSCTLATSATCTLSSACSSTSENYTGFDYQWTWETGDQPYCLPEIDNVLQQDKFYSEDLDPTGSTGSEDSGKTVLTGDYLYPFIDVDFYNNMSAAGMNCFTTGHVSAMSCFVSHLSSSSITLRTPVASQTGKVRVENADGSDASSIAAIIHSPFVRTSSPLQGPAGQYVTLKGANFIDFDPTEPTSTRGQVFFDGIEAEVMCTDGWDNGSIIVRVPDGFIPGDRPLIQVLTTTGQCSNSNYDNEGDCLTAGHVWADGRYSNQRAFEITGGEPGPGICLLDPQCSDTGEDDVTAIGENFGPAGAIYFTGSDNVVNIAEQPNPPAWDVFNSIYQAQSVVTLGEPVNVVDTYDFTVGNTLGISNGLDFNITCSEPPRVFEYFQCNATVDTITLPNAPDTATNACVNSTAMFAFTNDMNNASVAGNVQVLDCGYGFAVFGGVCSDSALTTETACVAAGEIWAVASCSNALYTNQADCIANSAVWNAPRLPFNDVTCTTPVAGNFNAEWLNDAYLGGSGNGFLNGSTDVDGDGDLDAYEAYVFNPVGGFQAGHYYKGVIPNIVTNSNGVNILEDYSWQFQVRNDPNNCVADFVTLTPFNELENSFDPTNLCPNNFQVDTNNDAVPEDYTFRTRQYTEDCILLNQAGEYDWEITPLTPDNDIVKFGTSDESNTSIGLNVTTIDTGYNNVCLQGQETINTGDAEVEVTLLDPNTGAPATSDTSIFSVDFGYCTSDADCFTNACQDTRCDLTTNRCTPDIIGFSPDNSTPENPNAVDVGPAGCLTLNGCYFGPDQIGQASCTCESLKRPGQTCTVVEGSSSCLLPNRTTTCSLGEQTCTLSSACTGYSASAVFYESGGLQGCECVAANGNTCLAGAGEVDCVAPGTSVCDPSFANYQTANQGSVSLDAVSASTLAEYPSPAICGDVWDNNQVIAQVPDTLPAGNYGVTLNSQYVNTLDGTNLSDTYSAAEGNNDCTVGTSATPCLCKVEPDQQSEGDTVDLFGEGFIQLVNGSQVASFKASVGRLAATVATWLDDNTVTDVEVPAGATGDALQTDNEGVRVQNNTLTSNSIHFGVSCTSNYDASTGCCINGNVRPAEQCNVCENNADCSFGDCRSVCVNGMCAPYVTDLSPKQGAVGQPVTVQGCHFGTYYDPASFTNYSRVAVDGIEAPLACGTVQSWKNYQIIVNMPEGIFNPANEDTVGETVVRQVYNNGDDFQFSNDALYLDDVDGDGILDTEDDFPNDVNNNDIIDRLDPTFRSVYSMNNACAEVDIPLLCDADPAYSAYTASYDVQLQGENFTDDNAGFCTCATVSLGQCNIAESATLCSVTENTTFFVNDNDTTETCTTATSNANVFYDGIAGACVFNDPAVTCSVAVNSASCTVSNTETCNIDENSDGTPDVCTDTVSTFVEQSGTVEYERDVNANIDDLQTVNNNDDDPDLYYVDVPEPAETGDVVAISTTSGDRQCSSNGLDFPITCTTCGDCSASAGTPLNCNLANNSVPSDVGVCTADTSGFCRAEPNSCCGNTTCIFDETTTNPSAVNYDTGTCTPEPIVALDVPAIAATSTTAATPAMNISVTNPEPQDTNVCPNGLFKVQFTIPVVTSAVYALNNDTDPANDIAPEAMADLTDWIYLRPENVPDSDTTTILAGAVLSDDGLRVTLEQGQVLSFNTEYEIILRGSANANNVSSGIVSRDQDAPLGCSAEQAVLGMCETDDVTKITFTTIPAADFAAACGPGAVDLEAFNQSFIDADYTYIKEGQKEKFEATVFAAGVDQDILTEEDNQPIMPLPGVFDWIYGWETQYDSIEDLNATACSGGRVGIITGGNQLGSCQCTFEESCDIAGAGAGNPAQSSCLTLSGATCTTDSPNEVCDDLDSNYDSVTKTCSCTVNASCSVEETAVSCTVDLPEEPTVTCVLGSPCDDTVDGFVSAGFNEDQPIQTATAGNQEGYNAVGVSVTGDGSVNDGWNGTLPANQEVSVVFCDSIDYLTTFMNLGKDVYWAYCRGDNPQSESFLPDFVQVFERESAEIEIAYGSPQDFTYEVAFKDELAIVNDPSANNNTIAFRLYPNDLDGDTGTYGDAINPDLWATLYAGAGGASATTINEYQAVETGNTTYVARAMSTLVGSNLSVSPQMIAMSYSEEAQEDTQEIMDLIKERIELTFEGAFFSQCGLYKTQLVNDTKRLNDLGTMAYLLSSYYFNDSNNNGVEDFPAIDAGSYITNFTGSAWPSWNATLGNELGQSLPVDPDNTYADAENNCPFNPPDLSAGDDPSASGWTYYDESGTCWDPVLNNFNGPADSHVYHYQYAPATGDFTMFANLELMEIPDYTLSSWAGSTQNPCSVFSEYSTGCDTFNYSVDPAQTIDIPNYANNFQP